MGVDPALLFLLLALLAEVALRAVAESEAARSVFSRMWWLLHGRNLSNEDSMLAGMGRTFRMCAGGMLCTCGLEVERVCVDVVGSVTVAKRDCDPLSLLPLFVLVDVLLVIVGFACGPPLLLLVVVLPLPGVPGADDPGGFPPALIWK